MSEGVPRPPDEAAPPSCCHCERSEAISKKYTTVYLLDIVRHPARFEKSPVIFILPAFA